MNWEEVYSEKLQEIQAPNEKDLRPAGSFPGSSPLCLQRTPGITDHVVSTAVFGGVGWGVTHIIGGIGIAACGTAIAVPMVPVFATLGFLMSVFRRRR